MKVKIGAGSKNVMNGVSESDRRRLGRMRFWVEDDLDGSRVVGVEKDEIDFGVLLDISIDIFGRMGQSIHFCIKVGSVVCEFDGFSVDFFSHIVSDYGVASTMIRDSRTICEDEKYVDRLVYVCHDIVLFVD